jgi:hypothetical protein
LKTGLKNPHDERKKNPKAVVLECVMRSFKTNRKAFLISWIFFLVDFGIIGSSVGKYWFIVSTDHAPKIENGLKTSIMK